MISGPNFAASRANRYAPFREQTRQATMAVIPAEPRNGGIPNVKPRFWSAQSTLADDTAAASLGWPTGGLHRHASVYSIPTPNIAVNTVRPTGEFHLNRRLIARAL